ncbi:MAG: orotidine-5'-phosphate decarboxylase [Magnetococcales bacterium]|nr:orotidine-5'-phosphate decarboxylase [Magnetococcales bacterium]
MEGFADRLIDRALARRSRVVVGLDPDIGRFPAFLRAQLQQQPTEAQLEEVVVAFNQLVIEATEAEVVAYKPQAAFYEQYGLAGMRALQRTLTLLRERGLLVIMDAKRNDVAHTAGAYGIAWLAPRHPLFDAANPWQVDALTLNGYLGSDGIVPFLEVNPEAGLFVLTKTSNPSSGELQDLFLWTEGGERGGTVAEKMAELVHQWGQRGVGRHGFSNVGMVVGATYPEMAGQLRRLAPQALFLMPGIGAQGGSLEGIVAGAGPQGVGAYAASSRSLLYPFRPDELADAHWSDRARARILAAAQQLRQAIHARLMAV